MNEINIFYVRLLINTLTPQFLNDGGSLQERNKIDSPGEKTLLVYWMGSSYSDTSVVGNQQRGTSVLTNLFIAVKWEVVTILNRDSRMLFPNTEAGKRIIRIMQTEILERIKESEGGPESTFTLKCRVTFYWACKKIF